MRFLALTVILGALFSLLPMQSPAQEEDSSPGTFYMNAGASHIGVQLPNYAPIAVRAPAGINTLMKRLESHDGTADGVAADFVIGMRRRTDVFSADGYFMEVRPLSFAASS